MFGDSSTPEDVEVRHLDDEARRVSRSRVVNPKWTESMQDHGYKGALEMAATVDFLFGYDATAEIVDDYETTSDGSEDDGGEQADGADDDRVFPISGGIESPEIETNTRIDHPDTTRRGEGTRAESTTGGVHTPGHDGHGVVLRTSPSLRLSVPERHTRLSGALQPTRSSL